MYILDKLDELDLSKTLRYIALRQDEFAGGFNGRTNKLVDSCYSWWIGTAARILSDYYKIPPFWNVDAMSRYLIQCAQVHTGGFRDSPPNNPDPFHTCFALAGLATVGSGELVKETLCELSYLVPVPKDKFEKFVNYFNQFPSIV